MDEKSRARLRELSSDRHTRVSFDGGSELNGLLRGRIAELEKAHVGIAYLLRGTVLASDLDEAKAIFRSLDIDTDGK